MTTAETVWHGTDHMGVPIVAILGPPNILIRCPADGDTGAVMIVPIAEAKRFAGWIAEWIGKLEGGPHDRPG